MLVFFKGYRGLNIEPWSTDQGGMIIIWGTLEPGSTSTVYHSYRLDEVLRHTSVEPCAVDGRLAYEIGTVEFMDKATNLG